MAEIQVVHTMQAENTDCMMHQPDNEMVHALHAAQADGASKADCCQNNAEHNCAKQASPCDKNGCQCEHASSHLVSYLAGIAAPFIVKTAASQIVGKPVVAFSGFPTSLFRPPIRLS
ncbi:MAG: hypothetical protein CBB67_011420 [Alteromonadaceae bacterium TMED7]|uniref:Uncharacterized protein n=1 Tax=Alteromonas alba TaxID=2079529 RepID=A0A2S9VEV5_9ALTE|nr:hypothetical protein [Alteromonas alba]MAJ68631.1 hypothetical protein [Alteromonadaceae bacterium]MCP4864603.1 hypothetical protein [Alteromonas sp.]PRO74988.1 hypothetical protein C6Y40_03485 [Alteromonas alba]RPH18530.1 MAG: hypothetical protein CBB67_011420 [Alteromonadaceae bacterium TMED7]|tara:strand:+ start:36247 stop:36597 length:351 start_codon:yes stop_codon:yes gene_type:complete